MKRVLIIAMVLCASFSKEAWAQKKVLTFQDAIKIAMKNSVLLNQQKNNLEYSEMQRTSAYAGLGPTVSANAGAQQTNGNYFNAQEARVINGVTDRIAGSINANITIFNGLSQVNRARANSSALEAQSYYVNRTAQDVMNSVSAQYLIVLLDGELLKIAQENFEVLKKQLEQVTTQVEVGSKSPVDQYNQDSQTKAAEIKAIQAEITQINDKALLTQILLMDPSEDFDVAKPDWDINAVGSEENELQTLFETALKNRGDYLRAKKTEEASKYAMKSSWASMTPALSAYGNFGSGYNHTHGDVNSRPFDLQFKTENLYKSYGLQLYVPIFGGNQLLQNRTAYVQQKVNHRNMQVIASGLEVQVKSDVLRTYQNFKLYKKTYAVSIEQLKSADIAFGYEKERYELGITSFVDYIQANKTLVQAQTDRAQAEYRLLFQKILMDYAMGTLKPEDLE